jgi:hypothetical protein
MTSQALGKVNSLAVETAYKAAPPTGGQTHTHTHAFMVLVALWSACSPRLSVTSNNLPGVKLYPPCLRPLATHHHLPGRNYSLYDTHRSSTHKTSFHCHTVIDCSNDDDNAVLGRQRHVAQQ